MKLGLGFSILVSLVIPMLMLIYYISRKRVCLKPFMVGVMVFFISQIVLRLPLFSYVLPNQGWYMKLSLNPYLYSVFLGLTAGIFEEVGRYIGFKYLLKNKYKYKYGLAFGFGHWGIEAVLIAGINAVALLFNPTLAQSVGLNTLTSFMIGIERLFAMSIHVGLSMIVLYGIKLNRNRYLFIAILLHTIVDSALGILPQLFNISTIVIEVYVFIWALVFLYLTYKIKKKYEELDNVERMTN